MPRGRGGARCGARYKKAAFDEAACARLRGSLMKVERAMGIERSQESIRKSLIL